MWWGGFSEHIDWQDVWDDECLNPHVVGRFFRVRQIEDLADHCVLIPMWWGGFSEIQSNGQSAYTQSLNPHVVGRFFRGCR